MQANAYGSDVSKPKMMMLMSKHEDTLASLPPSTLEAMDKYLKAHDSLTELQRAETENQIWMLLPDSIHGSTTRIIWLAANLKLSTFAVKLRSALFFGLPETKCLFDMVNDNKILLATAGRILRDANEYRKRNDDVSREEAISYKIKEYENTGVEVRLPDGRSFRRRISVDEEMEDTAETKVSEDTPSLRILASPVETVDVPPKKGREKMKGDSARARTVNFFEEIREHALVFAKESGGDAEVEDVIMERLISGLETDLKVAFDGFLARLRAVKKFNKNDLRAKSGITQAVLRKACLALAMDPPVFGKPVDLKKAEKQKRRTAAQYHPDKHAGDDSMRAQYENVLESFSLIEKYATLYNK